MRYTDFKIIFSEARRNPDQNPRQYALDQLEKYLEQDVYHYISYTAIDKIGINPQSRYDTPIGIYAYPLTMDIYDEMQQAGSSSAVPFAGGNPFIWVLRPKYPDNMMWVGDTYYREDEYRADLKKLKDYFVGQGIMDESRFDYKVEQYAGQAFEDTESSQIWNITRMLAKHDLKLKSRTPVKWNWLFRNILKYQGAVDLGSGTIHENEPTQAVFFSKDAFTVVEKLKNADAYSNMPFADKEKAKLKDPIDYILKTNPSPANYDRKSLTASTEIQQKLIQKNPTWATRIKNLDPLFYHVLKTYTYIVDEPGLTALVHGQALTRDDYKRYVDLYGDDAFSVEPFNP